MYHSNLSRKCKMCNAPFTGRKDKIFCSPDCKAEYHYKLKKVTQRAAKLTDKILHRNRSTLLEIMGKYTQQKIVPKSALDRKNFKYEFVTGFYENEKGKRYHIVYDFAWMMSSDGMVMILRREKDRVRMN